MSTSLCVTSSFIKILLVDFIKSGEQRIIRTITKYNEIKDFYISENLDANLSKASPRGETPP